MYAKDVSRKVKSAKRQRAYKGYYISAQAPYGYKVHPINRNRLIVDEEVAEVVKEIFQSGATVVGKGKGIFTSRYPIPPGTKVTIIRPE